MAETSADRDGDVTSHDAVKRPWATPRLMVHGKVPALTFTVSLKTAD